MSRADKLYAVLSDGRCHSRHEIFRACGEFFLTNNAASELRVKRGVEVTHTVKDGEHFYQLESPLDATEAPRTGSPSPVHPVPPVSVASSGVSLTDGRDVATPLALFDTERSAA